MAPAVAAGSVNWRYTAVMARVAVAADGMTAVLHLAAGEALALADLRALLASADVHHGLSRAALAAALAPAAGARALVVAAGEAAHDGGDDVIDLLLEAHGGARRPWLIEVAAGAALARLRHGRSSQPGRDVAGAELPAKPGRSADLAALAGDGTSLQAGDDPVLVATIPGAYTRDGNGKLAVRSPVVVPGDLDHVCGNLETGLPVVIKGDILAGFTLVCAADASVGGTVEDGRVQVGGDLTVGGGIVAGRQRVTVHGRLGARHIMGRAIRARAVALGGAAVDGDLIVAETRTCTALIGGHTFVGREVLCDQLGDAGETTTVVELGGVPFLAALAHEAIAERAATLASAGHLRERVHLLHHHLQHVLAEEGLEAAGAAAEELREAQSRLVASETAAERCQRIIDRHDAAQARGEATLASARLVVRKRVHAGVTVVFGAQKLVVEVEAGSSTFRLVEGLLVRE